MLLKNYIKKKITIGKSLAKRRIISDKREHLSRRRRYVQEVQYRITPMQNCAGWTYYQPYPIECGGCEPVRYRPQSPYQQVYRGPAKTWHGPRYGECCIFKI